MKRLIGIGMVAVVLAFVGVGTARATLYGDSININYTPGDINGSHVHSAVNTWGTWNHWVNVNSTYWEGLGPFNDPLLSTQGNAFDLALVQADWQWEGMQGVVGPNVTDGYAYKNNGWDGAYDLGAALTWTIPQLTAGNQTDFLTTANPLYDVVVYWGSNEGDVFIPRMFDNGGAHYSLTDLPAITVGTTTHGPGYQAQAYIGGYQYLQVITQQDPPPGAVPEPGTWLLLGGSLLGLCVGGFRRFVRK